MLRYIINGRQLFGGHGGVQRYLFEILRELDLIIDKNQIELAIPKKELQVPVFKNLKILRIGNLKGILWEQISFPLYLFFHHKKGVNLCTAVPLLYPFGINAIHDVMMLRYKQMRSAVKPFIRFLLKLNYYLAIKFADKIITVSNESKNDLINFYNVKDSKIVIIQNAWQHMDRIESVEPCLSFDLPLNNYYLGLSSNRWQKNFIWIEKVAKKNPNDCFIIVGQKDNQQKVKDFKEFNSNVHYVGFLSDTNIKFLYKNCKAFIFPSICEGFGIPPLEALACGAKVICSNSSCLPEIFSNSVYYISPYNADVDLFSLLDKKVFDASEILNKYAWNKSALQLRDLICQI